MVDSVKGMPNFFGRTRRQNLTVGVLHAGQARGRNRHRHGHRLAHHGAGGAAAFHVHGHALAQLDFLKVALVRTVGAFGPAARVGVVVKHARHALFGQNPQVFDGGDHGHSVSPQDGAHGSAACRRSV